MDVNITVLNPYCVSFDAWPRKVPLRHDLKALLHLIENGRRPDNPSYGLITGLGSRGGAIARGTDRDEVIEAIIGEARKRGLYKLIAVAPAAGELAGQMPFKRQGFVVHGFEFRCELATDGPTDDFCDSRLVFTLPKSGSPDAPIIARARLGIIADDEAWRLSGLLEDMEVDSAYRRQGLGLKLVEAVMLMAQQRGCQDFVALSRFGNAAAHRLYEKLGLTRSENIELRLDLI